MGSSKTPEREFLDILEEKNIDTKFQSIVDLKTGSILGFQAFGHGPRKSSFYKTKDSKRMANKMKKIMGFGGLLRTSAFDKANTNLNDKLLFLSVDPIVKELVSSSCILHNIPFKTFYKPNVIPPIKFTFRKTKKPFVNSKCCGIITPPILYIVFKNKERNTNGKYRRHNKKTLYTRVRKQQQNCL